MNWKKIICAWRGHKRGKEAFSLKDIKFDDIPNIAKKKLMQCPCCEDTWEKGKRPKNWRGK